MYSDGLGVRVEAIVSYQIVARGSLVRIPTGAVSFENQGSKFHPRE